MSVSGGAPRTTVIPTAASVLTVMSAGTVHVGASVSCTVTLNEAVPVLPAASEAVQFTVVVPSGNVLPETGVQLELVTPTLSGVVAV